MTTTQPGRPREDRADHGPTPAEAVLDAEPVALDSRRERARYTAAQLCLAFIAHDDRDRDTCVEALREVDDRQFGHLEETSARAGSVAFADALWAKDRVEAPYVDERTVRDADGLDEADWSPVRQALTQRAEALGIDTEYAEATTTAWRRHKTGGDYWTPTLRAQRHELDAALPETATTTKAGFGGSGFGSLPSRYLVAVECHDRHSPESWTEAVSVMTPYFEALFAAQEGAE